MRRGRNPIPVLLTVIAAAGLVAVAGCAARAAAQDPPAPAAPQDPPAATVGAATPAPAEQASPSPAPSASPAPELPRVIRVVCTDHICGGCDGRCSRRGGHVAVDKKGHCACTPTEGSALDRAIRAAYEKKQPQ